MPVGRPRAIPVREGVGMVQMPMALQQSQGRAGLVDMQCWRPKKDKLWAPSGHRGWPEHEAQKAKER